MGLTPYLLKMKSLKADERNMLIQRAKTIEWMPYTNYQYLKPFEYAFFVDNTQSEVELRQLLQIPPNTILTKINFIPQ